MTKAAIFEKKEEKNALRIVSYRRKDYIQSRLLLALLSVTIAYAIFVGTIMFLIVMAYESIILNLTQMIFIFIAIALGYALVLAFYYVVAHKHYGDKHVKARAQVKDYLRIIKALDRLNEEEERKGGKK